MEDVTNSLQLLFDRPNESLITPKGDKKAVFQLTDQFLPKEYESNGLELNNRFGDDASQKIPLKNLQRTPQFNLSRQLPHDADFSLFLPSHQKMADEVIEELMSVPQNQLQDFLSTCAYSRVNLNPQLFNYCYSVALMHRADTKNVPIANYAETFPSKFLDSTVFSQAREAAAVIPQGTARTPIIIPRDYTATDLEEEHRLAYFREDVGVNLHHWHWHLVYPFSAAGPNSRAIVAKDRRGELFFYMHQQIIARYNGERLNNALKRVKKFSNWREPIPEAYFPKLDSLTSSRGWPPRQANMMWQDLNRPVDGLNVTVSDMERWRRNIEEAVSTGRVRLSKGDYSKELELNNRSCTDATIKIPLKSLYYTPQFRLAQQLPHDADFTLFLPMHQKMADEVIEELMSVPQNQLQDFLSTCAYSRVNLNPQLFNYCFTVALMHRPDTKDVPIANYAESFPSKFLNSTELFQAIQAAAFIPQESSQTRIMIPHNYTATDLEEEHRLAYFREDVGVNLHHWHWHLVYPFSAAGPNSRAIVAKDRRGELFFYMHQQILARYNGERLNNALKRVKKFSNWREPIPEGYFAKLDSLNAPRRWPPRQANMTWQDLNRPVDGISVTVSDMECWRRNIEDAISSGQVILANDQTQPIDIDTLGNMMESSILSPNRECYGSLHNNGHLISAYIHDPTHRHLESFSLLADEATAMRDPFFYRWHAFIDDLFQKHKESSYVQPYTSSELENPGVEVKSVRIESVGSQQPNQINTYWMQSDVDLSRGLDFSDRNPVYARFTHLNHRGFKYKFQVNNTGTALYTTVRIFLAPKFDERNLAWTLCDQRKMFVEMDRFVVSLNSGMNTISRNSSQSSVCIPFDQTFRDLRAQGSNPRHQDLAGFNYCGCGWPLHMLVPKGTEIGAPYQLYVMLSNYDMDKVDQPDGKELTCQEASTFCGLKGRLYPDKRPMGFPFDRPSRHICIEDFILPNMALVDVCIRLQNTTEPNPRNVHN